MPNTVFIPVTRPKESKTLQNLYDTMLIAKKTGWRLLDHQENIKMVSFRKWFMDGLPVRINIYLTTMTVGTFLNHPKKGRTQLFRKNVDLDLLEKIFENPRIHSNKGYSKRKK